MYAAIHWNSSDCANGDDLAVSTGTTRMRRARTSPSTSFNAGRSNTSRSTSRVASSRIGKLG